MSAETKTTEVPKKMTAWALFMDRVASLTPLPRSEVMQLSSYLKGQKDMIAWKDAEIIAAIPEWTASKGVEAKKEEMVAVTEKPKRKTKEAKEEAAVTEKPKRKAKEPKEPKEAKEAKEAKETKKGSAAAGEEDPSSEPATATSAPASAPSTSSVVEMLELQLNQTKKKLDTSKAELSKAESDTKVLVDRAIEARAKAKALTKEAEEACLMTAKVQTVVYELETEVAAKKVEFEKAEAAAAVVAAAAAAFQQATNSSTSAVSVTVSTPAAPSTEEDAAEPLHVRRKKIPSSIRTLVWNKYIGADVAQSDCFCCRTAKISVRSFDCGHVIAEAKGGDLTINNLRPICKDCNKSMGTRSMNEFTKEYFGWTV